MSAFILIITLLLGVAFWRQLLALLATGVILLVVLGIVFLLETMSNGTGGGLGPM